MTDTPQHPATFGNVEALFDSMVPDPEQPARAAGNPTWMYASLTEGATDSGVWSSTVGGWNETDYPADEVMVLTEGRLRITETDGTITELSAGDMFFLPRGWAGRWDVLEDMRKIYVMINR